MGWDGVWCGQFNASWSLHHFIASVFLERDNCTLFLLVSESQPSSAIVGNDSQLLALFQLATEYHVGKPMLPSPSLPPLHDVCLPACLSGAVGDLQVWRPHKCIRGIHAWQAGGQWQSLSFSGRESGSRTLQRPVRQIHVPMLSSISEGSLAVNVTSHTSFVSSMHKRHGTTEVRQQTYQYVDLNTIPFMR